MERKDYVNVDDALKRVRGNMALYGKMLKMFLASEDYGKFEAAIAEGDLKTASEVAHSIKGIAGNLSLTKLFEESAELMTKLREGVNDAALAETFKETFKKTNEYINEVLSEM